MYGTLGMILFCSLQQFYIKIDRYLKTKNKSSSGYISQFKEMIRDKTKQIILNLNLIISLIN